MFGESIKIFVISLVNAVERRNHINTLFSSFGIDYEFIDAVEGSTIDDSLYNEINDTISDRTNGHIKKMIPNEIGCALSHINAYQKIIDNQISSAIIFEDDVFFDQEFANFIKILATKNNLINNYDLALLGYSHDLEHYSYKARISIWKRGKINKYAFGKPTIWYWHAFSYFINNKGASQLLNAAFPIRMPADYLTANCENYGLRFGVIKSPIVWPGRVHFESTIGYRPQEIPVINPLPQNRNFIVKTINRVNILRKIKLQFYTFRDSFKELKVKLRILSYNTAKFYIKKF